MPEESAESQLFNFANRVLDLIRMIILLLLLIVVGLLIFYGYLITQPQEIMGALDRKYGSFSKAFGDR